MDIKNQEREEVASENGGEAEDTQESDNDTDNDSQETESSSPETSTTFHSKSPCEHCENSNVYGTLIMKCPKCFWHDYYKIRPICDHQIPEERNCIKDGFLRCHDRGAVTYTYTKTRRRWKPIFIPTSFPGFSLLLRERTLVAVGHVESVLINCAAGAGPSLNFVDWTMKYYLG